MLYSTHWATQVAQSPLTTAVLMSYSATEEHSWSVCVALSALMSCAFSLHPVQDWWSGSVTCKRVLRHVAFPAWAAGGQGALLYDCLRCHIDEGRIGSGLIWVLHHGDVWSSRPCSSTGTRVCVHLCGSLAKCFPSVKCLCCSLFLSAGSTSQRRWFALVPKFHSWLHRESLAKVELFILTPSHLNTQDEGLKKGIKLQPTSQYC